MIKLQYEKIVIDKYELIETVRQIDWQMMEKYEYPTNNDIRE